MCLQLIKYFKSSRLKKKITSFNEMTMAGSCNVGVEYHYKVLTYLAASLSENPKVTDYSIHTNFNDIPCFDDFILKVWYEEEPYVYLGQVKHRENEIDFDKEKHNLFHYNEYMETIINNRNKIAIFESVPKENIHFWYFTNNYINKNIQVSRQIPCVPISIDLKADTTYEIPLLHWEGTRCYKLTPHNASEDELSFKKLYLLLNQPNISQIEIAMQNIFGLSRIQTENIIKYVEKYLNIPKIGGLTKYIFEVEVFRIHLYKMVVKPTLAVDMNENQASVWNRIVLNHDLTIIENERKIENSLFGCLLQRINEIYGIEFNWNDCIIQNGKLINHFDLKKFINYCENKDIRHWISTPDRIDSLIEIMWKYDDLPLILNTKRQLGVLKKYKHLKKKIVIIDNAMKRDQELGDVYRNIFTNISDIKSISLRDELLQKILVSLQGRKPNSLYEMFPSDEILRSEITRFITPSDVLNLMKKRHLFLKKSILQETEMMVFIIYDENTNNSFDNFDDISGQNVVVKLKSNSEDTEYKERLKKYLQLEKRTVVEATLMDNDKLQLLTGDVEKLKHFIVDEDGYDVYSSASGEVVPIIEQESSLFWYLTVN